ncbi:unnamed protein product [Arctogadus glacialis]
MATQPEARALGRREGVLLGVGGGGPHSHSAPQQGGKKQPFNGVGPGTGLMRALASPSGFRTSPVVSNGLHDFNVSNLTFK